MKIKFLILLLILMGTLALIVAYIKRRKRNNDSTPPNSSELPGPIATVSNTGGGGGTNTGGGGGTNTGGGGGTNTGGGGGTNTGGGGGTNTGGGGGTNTGGGTQNGFAITGIGQIVTGANPQQSYHTVAAPARVINVDTTPDGSYPCSVTINGHTESFTLDARPTGYPAVYFNPTTPVWGITSAGTYSVSITVTIEGVVYTKTTSTTVTNQDLGIIDNGGGGTVDNNEAVASSVRTDLINVVKNSTTGLWSDTTSDVMGDYVAYYFVNGVPYLNADGSRKRFENETLRAGSLVQIGKMFLHQNYYSSYADWLTNGWKTKIKVGNDYPNDWWAGSYAQQDLTIG